MRLKKYSSIASIFSAIILLSNINCTFAEQKSNDLSSKINNILNGDMVLQGTFIMELAQITKVNLPYTKGSDVKVYFKDVKDKDPYAKALMDAQFLGFIEVKHKMIMPKKPITLVEAKQLALNYFMYNFKNADAEKFSSMLDKNFKKKYGDVKTSINRQQANFIEDYLRYQLALAKRNNGYGKNKTVKYVIASKVKVTQKRTGDKIYVTLDWGQKPTSGYSIKILGYSYEDGLLILSYVAKEPEDNDKVVNNPTYPKAAITIDASKMAQNIKVLALGQR